MSRKDRTADMIICDGMSKAAGRKKQRPKDYCQELYTAARKELTETGSSAGLDRLLTRLERSGAWGVYSVPTDEFLQYLTAIYLYNELVEKIGSPDWNSENIGLAIQGRPLKWDDLSVYPRWQINFESYYRMLNTLLESSKAQYRNQKQSTQIPVNRHDVHRQEQSSSAELPDRGGFRADDDTQDTVRSAPVSGGESVGRQSAADLSEDAEREAAQIRERARQEAEALRQRTEREVQEFRAHALSKAAHDAELLRAEGEEYKKRAEAQAHYDADEIRRRAEQEAEDVRRRAEQEADEIRRRAEQEAEDVRRRAEQEAGEAAAELKARYLRREISAEARPETSFPEAEAAEKAVQADKRSASSESYDVSKALNDVFAQQMENLEHFKHNMENMLDRRRRDLYTAEYGDLMDCYIRQYGAVGENSKIVRAIARQIERLEALPDPSEAEQELLRTLNSLLRSLKRNLDELGNALRVMGIQPYLPEPGTTFNPEAQERGDSTDPVPEGAGVRIESVQLPGLYVMDYAGCPDYRRKAVVTLNTEDLRSLGENDE